ncbi:phosphoglycerate mutase-like protein 4 isoform X4 [Amborella trichopoda]|uniref:phosphoglycerate mutase-like protein 4 isoform X4 n=1 Tax=Amborella trichopoda TaxID=13333 RepID=UPI0009BD024A|nr:phosphoglycerate mutase-like protein 4 isoform X4 [Amborella trichopoda]|eukprot:XP_020517632.1 phosphoglycerate mutase-like protein 4 isoform X4 [Amborella trichopoda]
MIGLSTSFKSHPLLLFNITSSPSKSNVTVINNDFLAPKSNNPGLLISFPRLGIGRRKSSSCREFLPLLTPGSRGRIMTDSINQTSASSTCLCTNTNSSSEIGTLPPDVTEIVVVRHGETTWNASGRIQGHLDVELNEVGLQQAIAVAERLSKESEIAAVYSSDLKRAFDTAKIIAEKCKLAEGGGESLDQLFKRCTSCLERLSNEHKGKRVVVVTHGGVIRALHKRAGPSRVPQPGKIMNASINIFHLSCDYEWIIKSWGDVSHLRGTGFLTSAFGGDKNSG